MPGRPSVTATSLARALIRQGVVTELQLVSLLGQSRHQLTLNNLEQALIRGNALSNQRLLEIKAEVAQLPAMPEGPHTGPEGTALVAPGVGGGGCTAMLRGHVALDHGAIVVARSPLTVAMVEDTERNVAEVERALGQPFEVWLVTAPIFRDLYRITYEATALDERPLARDLFEVLDLAVAEKASDIHLAVGVPPKIRANGGLHALPFQPLDREWMRTQARKIAEDRHIDELDATFSTDLAYTFGTSRFRVNIANDTRGLTMSLRSMPSRIPSPAEIDLPESVRRFADLERGLVLVTGPTGAGKSTTLAAVLHEIITQSSRHIITLEDPVEFQLPTDAASHVNQRELGSSFASFSEGLRDALRQDPDVIFVGELRDAATVRTALLAAETGHLCISTLHSHDAASTVMRLVNSFPAEEQDGVRSQLSQLLRGVVSQILLPRASNKGRIAAFEVMLNNPAIATNLAKHNGHNQIRQTMETSLSEGMQTMEQGLASLVHRGLVTRREAEFRAYSRDKFLTALQHLERLSPQGD